MRTGTENPEIVSQEKIPVTCLPVMSRTPQTHQKWAGTENQSMDRETDPRSPWAQESLSLGTPPWGHAAHCFGEHQGDRHSDHHKTTRGRNCQPESECPAQVAASSIISNIMLAKKET